MFIWAFLLLFNIKQLSFALLSCLQASAKSWTLLSLAQLKLSSGKVRSKTKVKPKLQNSTKTAQICGYQSTESGWMSEVALENLPCHLIVDCTVGFLERLPRLMIKESREFNSVLFAPKNQKEREKKLQLDCWGSTARESRAESLFRLNFRSSLAWFLPLLHHPQQHRLKWNVQGVGLTIRRVPLFGAEHRALHASRRINGISSYSHNEEWPDCQETVVLMNLDSLSVGDTRKWKWACVALLFSKIDFN